jgi:ribosomal protein S17E
MLAAKFTGLEISSQDNDFRIAFNQNSTDQNQLNQQEVQKMMGQVLANYEQKLEEKRVEDKQELQSYLAKQSNQNKAIIDNYLTSLQQNNLQLMETYWKESNEQQQVYTERLLSDFAEYVQEQRQEDMDYLFAKMELMESDKDLFKIETGQMINALASNQSAEEAY